MAKRKLTTEQEKAEAAKAAPVDRKANEEAALAAIQEVLDRYNCELRARITIEGGSTETRVVIRSKDTAPAGE